MKKFFLFSVLALSLFLVPSAGAITIDGNLGDWGVTPFTDWTPDAPNTHWIEQNNVKGPNVPNQGTAPTESFDLEAMYFQHDGDRMNVLIIGSSRATHGWDADLAFDFGDDGVYETGVSLRGYGQQDQLVQRTLNSVPSWDTSHGGEWNLPIRMENPTVIGQVDAYQAYLGRIEPGQAWKDTFAIELGFDTALLGITDLCKLPVEIVYTKISCLKDSIVLNGVCNGDCGGTEIPEPTSVLLLGAGLLGMARFRKAKK